MKHVSRFTFHVSRPPLRITHYALRDALALLGIALIAALVWVGQSRAPDLYLEKIKATGMLRVGVDPTYPPFATVRDGQIEGYEADLARAIAADLGARVEFVPLALDSLYDALAAGNADVLISSLPFIYERQQEVRYSQLYYDAGQVLVVDRDGSRVTGASDLGGKTVGVELGSAADTEARRFIRTAIPSMKREEFDTPQIALDALNEGHLDAVITDNTSAHAYARDHADVTLILSPPLTSEPYVIAMPASASTLAAEIDATLARLRTTGELARMMGLR